MLKQQARLQQLAGNTEQAEKLQKDEKNQQARVKTLQETIAEAEAEQSQCNKEFLQAVSDLDLKKSFLKEQKKL